MPHRHKGIANPDKELWIVDDDRSTGDCLRSFLVGRGYRAVTVASAEKAVRLYQRERPLAVLLDVMMPGSVDGFEALAAFRTIDRTVPIIVVSGQGRTATVVQAMKLGAADFVCKPFEGQDLEASLANALKQRQRSCEIASMRDQHGLALAAHRVAAAAAWRPASLEPVGAASALSAQGGLAAVAAPEWSYYSLKDISRMAAREVEREWILKMLQQTRWNRKETAERLGISYKALLRKIKEGGLDPAP